MFVLMNKVIRLSRWRMLIYLLSAVGLVHAADWFIPFKVTNVNPSGNSPSAEVYFGEHTSATDGYDMMFDFKVLEGGMTTLPILMYFPQTTWGIYNGNYQKDIRSTSITAKTWNTRITRNSTFSNNYLFEWTLPNSLPGYLTVELVLGTTVINMRNQNSHAFVYSTPTTAQNFVLRTAIRTNWPYVQSPIPAQQFSDNLLRSLNLGDYFATIGGTIIYSLTNNPNLVQEIAQVNGQQVWRYRPVNGFAGTTYAEITASGSSGSCVHSVQINRDNTNTPPGVLYSPGAQQLLQNQSLTVDYANAFYDVDLDELVIEAVSGNLCNAVWDNANQRILLIPNPAAKGIDTVYVQVQDSVNEPVLVSIPVVILPSTPKAVENVQLTPSATESGVIHLSWNAVTLDTANLPLDGLGYRINIYMEPPENSQSTIWQSIITSETEYTLALQADKVFFQIITINE